MSIRILIVDDCGPWRITVRSILERNRSFQVVGEAVDGIEAIKTAATLRPDVVLLDIRMPRLNGIEAARVIKQNACPESKVIFLTQEDDNDVRSVALETGAAAYVLKSDASELFSILKGLARRSIAKVHGRREKSSVH